MIKGRCVGISNRVDICSRFYPGACFSALFLGPDPYEYIIIRFERKNIMMNKYEKCNICFPLVVCHDRSQHIRLSLRSPARGNLFP